MTYTSSPPQAPIRTVAVIGAGTAGRSFAIACAAAGFQVILEDVMPVNLRRAEEEYSSTNTPGAPHLEEMWEGSRPKGRGSLTTALTVEDACRTADLAIDFVPDELESKLEIFSMLDRMAPPRTILLTPSDAQSIADLASCTYRADRCLAVRGGLAAGHASQLVHPPHTDAAVLAAVSAFLRALGCSVSIQPDTTAPILVKNQPRS